MNLEADQAVQEARFAGACQDQHAGRPSPNLGWPGERQQAETSVVSRNEPVKVTGAGARVPAGAWGSGLGAGASRALGPGLQALGPGLNKKANQTEPLKSLLVRGRRRGFSPSPLLNPSNTPPKVGGLILGFNRLDP